MKGNRVFPCAVWAVMALVAVALICANPFMVPIVNYTIMTPTPITPLQTPVPTRAPYFTWPIESLTVEDISQMPMSEAGIVLLDGRLYTVVGKDWTPGEYYKGEPYSVTDIGLLIRR